MWKWNGRILRRLRKDRGETLRDLAEAMGTYISRVSGWETSKRTPRAETVRRLAELYDYPMEAFFDKVTGEREAT